MLSIGLMSGTSMDGIDAALIKTDGKNHIEEIANISLPYDSYFKILLKAAEFAVKKSEGNLSIANTQFLFHLEEYLKSELNISTLELSETKKKLLEHFHKKDNALISLDQIIRHSTDLHYEAVKLLLIKSHLQPKAIDVIGYHGQTLFHAPKKNITLQVGYGDILATKTGIIVINNFRSNDVMSGGQGAPFAPLYHQALAVRDHLFPLAVVNCGGISNITVIQGQSENQVLGFDTGPGNGLIDRLVKLHTHGRESMDANGKYGSQGNIHENILDLLYQTCIQINGENFFHMLPPKSLDLGDLKLIPELVDLPFNDACATLEAFTADSIVYALKHIHTDIPSQWILAGGGWHNPMILDQFKTRLQKHYGQQMKIRIASEIGWNSAAIEAQTFAYLAVRSLQNMPISYPGITQVPKPLCGGVIHHP